MTPPPPPPPRPLSLELTIRVLLVRTAIRVYVLSHQVSTTLARDTSSIDCSLTLCRTPLTPLGGRQLPYHASVWLPWWPARLLDQPLQASGCLELVCVCVCVCVCACAYMLKWLVKEKQRYCSTNSIDKKARAK